MGYSTRGANNNGGMSSRGGASCRGVSWPVLPGGPKATRGRGRLTRALVEAAVEKEVAEAAVAVCAMAPFADDVQREPPIEYAAKVIIDQMIGYESKGKAAKWSLKFSDHHIKSARAGSGEFVPYTGPSQPPTGLKSEQTLCAHYGVHLHGGQERDLLAKSKLKL